VKLELRDLVVRYKSGRSALTAVDRVSFGIPAGSTLGLVGESGCGKSSIARAIVGLVPVHSGRIFLDGVDFSSTSARDSWAYRRKVQLVFQDPYSSLNPRMTVRETLTEVMPRSLGRADRRKEALRVLDLVGLADNALERYPHQFSGGQRQRIAIARALAIRPDVIINDEVTSSLDVSVQATILNLLKDLQREFGLTYIFISHDLSSVRYVSDSVAVMYLGRIIENKETNELFRAPGHPYTQVLIQCIPKFGEPRRSAPIAGDVPDPRDPPRGCMFHTRCPIGPIARPERRICIELDPQTIVEQRGGVACHFSGDPV
jgi:peptide/nickel transport system ATP-binding protein